MHEFHPYNPDTPQIITSFKGNQKLILGGFRYNIHHVKEGVKTWRCVCAKKLTGTRTWCKGRAETWDSDTKGTPKGEHNHSTEHELAELEYFKSQMILAAISEPTADLSALMDEAAKFLSEGLNFGNRESMKKSLLVARKSVESGEFSLGKHRTVSSTMGQQHHHHQRSSSSATGKKKGVGGGAGTTATTTAAHQSGKATAASSAAAPRGTVQSKSGVPAASLHSVSAVPMPSSSSPSFSSSSKFPVPSPFKRGAVASSDGTAAFDTSGASCSNTSGYGTLSSSSGFMDEDAAAHGIGWMDLSGESGHLMMPEQMGHPNATASMNGAGHCSSAASSTDQQNLLAAALFAAAMLGGNASTTTPATTTTIGATLCTSLANSNSSTTIDTTAVQNHYHHQQQHQSVGEVMMSMMMPTNNGGYNTNNNNKGTKRAVSSARSSSTTSVGVGGAGQATQQGPSAAAIGTYGNSRNAGMNARKKTARVNCILNKLSTKAAEKSVSPSPSSNNSSEPCPGPKIADPSAVECEQKNGIVRVVQPAERQQLLVTVATQTDPVNTVVVVGGAVAEDEELLKGTRKRKSDENAPNGRARQQNANGTEGGGGTEKRKVICCCCCEESELSEWDMPLECKRRVQVKAEQNGTAAQQQQKPKTGQEEEEEEHGSEGEEEMFGIDHEIKLEIAEEEEEGEEQQHKQLGHQNGVSE